MALIVVPAGAAYARNIRGAGVFGPWHTKLQPFLDASGGTGPGVGVVGCLAPG